MKTWNTKRGNEWVGRDILGQERSGKDNELSKNPKDTVRSQPGSVWRRDLGTPSAKTERHVQCDQTRQRKDRRKLRKQDGLKKNCHTGTCVTHIAPSLLPSLTEDSTGTPRPLIKTKAPFSFLIH